MKITLILLALVTAIVAQSEPWCRCGVFITFEYEEVLIYSLDNINIDSCNDVTESCKTGCVSEIDEYSNNGDLWHVTPSSETVGQQICTRLASDEHSRRYIHNRYAYGYFGVCAGPWEYTDIISQQMLCCEDGIHVHCIN